MKRILLPTDFSSNANNAIKYALSLYKNEVCKFYILNTFTPSIIHHRFVTKTVNSMNPEEVHSTSEQNLQETLKYINRKYPNPNHSFQLISSFNLLADEIKEIVDRENIELIIMGSKGNSNLKEVFLGSSTVRILKSIKKCPVLIIPGKAGFSSPDEIAFVTDFNRYYTASEIQPIIQLANSFNITVRIVHIQKEIKSLTELQRFNLGVLRKYLADVEHYVHTVSEVNSISRTLEIFTDELEIHLLAMLNYEHSYMEKITDEPVVKQQDFYTTTPLLVIPELSEAYLAGFKKMEGLLKEE